MFGLKLCALGYLFTHNADGKNGCVKWQCELVCGGECSARAITTRSSEIMILYCIPEQSPHSHTDNADAAKAEAVRASFKSKSIEEPHLPPAKMIRQEISDLSITVLSQLPECENLRKAFRGSRRRNLRSLGESGGLPEIYTRTLTKEQFLVYD